VIVQAGSFAEHRFGRVRFTALTSAYPGEPWAYQSPPLATEERELRVDAPQLQIELPPGTEIYLQLETLRNRNTPTYHSPWGAWVVDVTRMVGGA